MDTKLGIALTQAPIYKANTRSRDKSPLWQDLW